MRREATALGAMLILLLGGCTFNTAGMDPSGGVFPKRDGGGDTAPGSDTGPRPDGGGKAPDAGPKPDASPKPDLPRLDQIQPDQIVTPDASSCGGKLYTCKGAGESLKCVSGKYMPHRKCPMGCNPAKGRCNSFDAINGAAKHLDKVGGKWTISSKVTLDTASGAFSPSQPSASLVSSVESGMRVLAVGDMEITKAGALKVTGKLPLLIVSSKSIVISGTLDVSADGANPGPGGAPGGGKGKDGSGCGGGPLGKPWYWGGAGGSHGGTGGEGYSKAKVPCGAACTAPLTGGSGGGDGDGNGGNGGAGGGAVQLTAWSSITVAGAINAGGGGGRKGEAISLTELFVGAGGGGGSGGAIVLEAPTLTVAGVVAANGGGGGGAGKLGGNGSNGADGAASTSSAAGGKGASSTASGDGGGGSSQKDNDGQSGMFSILLVYGGGGGGGAGRICVRTLSKSYGGSGSFSPVVGAGIAPLQKLNPVSPP